jgi:hypothetical protein
MNNPSTKSSAPSLSLQGLRYVDEKVSVPKNYHRLSRKINGHQTAMTTVMIIALADA